MKKTIIFVNLRFAHFYSKELVRQIKRTKNVRFVAIIDQQFKNNIPEHIAPYLDQVYLLSAKTKDGFLAEFDLCALRQILCQEKQLNADIRLVCLDEFNLINTGQLRREFFIPGNTDEELLPYRDKIKMKTILRSSNIRVPKFKSFSLNDNFADLIKEFDLPFVLKPIDSCGSHGVTMITNQENFDHFKAGFSQYEDAYEVEEYIDGDLYHVDSYTQHGEIKFICANEYTCPNFQYTNGQPLGSIPVDGASELSQKLIEFAKQCLCALGGKNLINHMEIFVNRKNEFIFLEVSARPPGALINLTHRINFGINLTDEDFFMQTGEYLQIKHEKNQEQAFWVLFPLRPGRVAERYAPRVQSRMDLTWFVDRGHYITQEACKNVVGKSAQAIFYSRDYACLRNDFESLKQHKILEMSNG